MKNIAAAIATHSAHDLADALAEAGVSTTRDDTKCVIPGYGTVRFDDLAECPCWVVTVVDRVWIFDLFFYDCEMAKEMVAVAKQIS